MKTLNPRKRPLLSMDKKPNKYSSGGGGSGSKKRALNGRPPQPASVARLESLLDGATKKKRKSKSRVIDGDIIKERNNQDSIRTIQRISKDGMDRSNNNTNIKRSNNNNTITGQRWFSDENTRNEAACGDNGRDRWSHLNSTAKSKDRKRIVNPFLETNRTQNAKKTKTDDLAAADVTDTAESIKSAKISPDLFQSKAKKDRKKKKHSIIKSKGGFRKEENISNKTPLPILAAAITSRKAIQSLASADKINYYDTPYNNSSKELTILNSLRTNGNNHGIQNCSRLRPASSSTLEETIPNNHVGKKQPAISDETSLLMQKSVGKRAAMSPTISEASSPKSNERGSIASDSSFRPKLGLRLCNNNNNNKTTKGNKPAASASSSSGQRFYSSLPLPSSPTEFLQTTTPAAAKGNGADQEDGLLMVLGSPGKSSTSPSLPNHSKTANHGISFDESTIIENGKPAGVQHAGLSNTTWGTNGSANSRNKWNKPNKKKNMNDNFVRQNLKNNAGACRGAKNKSSKFSKERRSWTFRGSETNGGKGDENNYAPQGSFTNPTLTFDAPVPPTSSSSYSTNNHESNNYGGDDARSRRFNRSNKNRSSKTNATSYVSKMSGLDPLDEFVDGTFHSSETKTRLAKTKAPTKSTAAAAADAATTTATATPTVFGETIAAEAPKCARHQRPCKKIKVRKATTGNKGREFYACSMPRGEQCDHFQWADDTVEAARCTLAKNSTYSNFITRQVAAYVDRFRTFTVPELKEETAKRGLNKNGKKQQLLMRLALWTRDELVKCSPELVNEELENSESETTNGKIELSCPSDKIEEEEDDSDSDDSSSSSEDELELFDGDEGSEQEDAADSDDEEMSCETNKESSNDSLAVTKGKYANVESSLSESLWDIFGHDSFRDGQEWAIQRCLDEKSSLLVAPTGFGKSLCYALPAALMDGVCIVVSPLISLIQDQLRSLPPRIPAATLSGSVSAAKTAAILDDIVRKRLKILFVSPERLTSPAFRRLFNLAWNPETKTRERKFPEISLLCIDEAHCISQWAHNFRPCFLRFKGFLNVMKPKSILAITATAGPRVIRDIGQTLGLDFPESITEESPKTFTDIENESIKIIRSGRDNIDVMGKFMSNQEERLAVVAGILTPAGTTSNEKKKPYAGKLARGSVIVYVWRQRDTEVVAESLTAAGIAGGVVIYHGGMDANARAKSQSKFMRGKARICVATVAFGLGIDKADIVGIVHLYLSNSPEHYLQEIGRAGRDGRSATAIALPLLEEVPTRHSLGYSNLVAKSQIRSLLCIIRRLVESAGNVCDMVNSNSGRFLHIALPVQSTVRACDCKPETIETFLSLIERIGGNNPLLQIEGYNYDGATIALKKRTLTKLAEREAVAVSIQAVSQCVDAPLTETGAETEKVSTTVLPKSFQRHFLAYSKGSHSFSISQCANRLGPTAEPRHVFAALRRMQSSNELEFVLDTSETGRIFQLKVSETGFGLFRRDDYGKMEENLVDAIFESFSSSSDSGATKFLDMHYILDQVATASELSTDGIDASEQISSSDKSPSLFRFQELTGKYFGEGLESERLAIEGLLPASFSTIREKELKIDGLSLLRDLPPLFQQNSEKDPSPEHLKLGDASRVDYTALAITKFLHGMDTPRTPYLTFRQYPLFGKWKTVDFRLVHESILKVVESRT